MDANLTDLTSGGISGTPSSLPTGWTLANGYLIGSSANLAGANLTGVDLTGADLTGVNLTGANLTGANLTRATLIRATLTDASISGANLTGADLTDVVSSGLIGPPASLPDGWTIVDGSLTSPLTSPPTSTVAAP
ncbi:unannotated protein [freshwater metagenome]